MRSRSPEDLPVRDLLEILDLGRVRAGDLLTGDEVAVLGIIEALEGQPARLYARLTGRVPEVFAVDALSAPGVPEVGAALAHLEAAGLVDPEPPWAARLQAVRVPGLRAACRRLGLDARGRRADLVGRLEGHVGWSGDRFVGVRYQALVRRMERLAFLRVHPDRSALVVERLGHVVWPRYEVTGAGALFRTREDLLAWEALADGLEALDAEACLEALEAAERWPPGRLDLSGRLRRRVLEEARELERAGEPGEARSLYLRLVAGGWARPGRVAVRVALTLEAEGRGADALQWLDGIRASCGPGDRIALGRTGRRIARTHRRGWVPDPPLASPPERHLRLPAGSAAGRRPLYRIGEVEAPVEGAVVAALAAVGRRALLAEGPLWTTLYALLLAETYFLPVPGMLPTRFLSGPLDVGTAGYAERRRDAVEAVLEEVDRGGAPELILAADVRYRGVSLAGASWERASGEDLAAVAEGLGPLGLRAVLEVLLEEGWRASRGLPDLVLLPGEQVRVRELLPSRLTPGPLLVELKGPGDQLRDEQLAWLDRLVRAGVPAELWRVTPLSGA